MASKQPEHGGSTAIERLLRSLSPTKQVEVIETHISWIVLYDQIALKLKKPLANPFLDYSTLSLRRQACFAELRLNQRYASDLYQAVVAIVSDNKHFKDTVRIVELPDDPHAAALDASDGPILDYAVKMRRFDADALLAYRLEHGLVSLADIDQLAKAVADFHANAQACDRSNEWGTSQTVIQDAIDNLDFLSSCGIMSKPDELSTLRDWTEQSASRLTDTFESRRQQDMVRECHGDLHLENIIAWQGCLIPFDGIEFSEQLRWIDIQNDAAFTSMDLAFHNYAEHAHRFINTYLEQSGDYEGLIVLRWYQVYRALVRAKVALLRGQQESNESAMKKDVKRAQAFVQLAVSLSKSTTPKLMITHGLSGSGKTHGSQKLIDETGAIRIRSDVERKRAGRTQHKQALYSLGAKQEVYQRLYELAEQILIAGYSTIVDATFLDSENRDRFRALAEKLNLRFEILDFDADIEILKKRISIRQSEGSDASDANLDVLHQQIAQREPLSEAEQTYVVKMNA